MEDKDIRKVRNFKVLMKQRVLTEFKYVPPDSTIIYVSHEWLATEHPDPRGDQMYHLIVLLERLYNGEVNRTEMDAFHSLLYKHNHTTTEDFEVTLNPQKDVHFLRRTLCAQRRNERKVFE